MTNSNRWRGFVAAAVASALACILAVAVGPSFSAPEDEAATETVATEETVATTATAEETSTVAAAENNGKSGTPPGQTSTSTGSSTASTTPDSHGHVGAGTGLTEGSQADPGHKTDTNGTDGKTNGPGTGDTPAPSCPNPHQGADAPQGGANQNPGPYDNTCHGQISQNGQGDDAPGKGTPCAGCVGNADDKNPPGQVKEWNGEGKNNMGYECDGNQGVGAHYGNGNPAHTGCVSPAPQCTVDMNPNVDGIQCTAPPCLVDMNPNVDGIQCTAPPCLVDMNPNVDGIQCTAPPCLVDMNPNVDGIQCTAPLCTVDMNPYVNGTQCEPPELCPDNTYPPGGDMSKCDTPPPCETDMNPYVNGTQCEPPELCPDNTYPPGGDMSKCDTPPCTVDMNPYVNGTQCEPPELCPDNTYPPGGDMTKCDTPPPCETDMNPYVNGLQCAPPELCPDNTYPPGGDMDKCDKEVKTCPAGSDMAGEPIPPGGVKDCDDDVLGDTIDNDGDVGGDTGPDVLSGRETPNDRPAGAVMPFTGASVLAYALVGLHMIGAGALIARGRKRK